MFIKICGITTEDDALLAVAMGADAVGFIFAPSERQVSPQNVYDITRRLPPETMTVGVFRNDLPDRVLSVADRAGVKAVQLHGSETPDQVAEIVERGPGHGIRWVIRRLELTLLICLGPISSTPMWCWSTPHRQGAARCLTGISPQMSQILSGSFWRGVLTPTMLLMRSQLSSPGVLMFPLVLS